MTHSRSGNTAAAKLWAVLCCAAMLAGTAKMSTASHEAGAKTAEPGARTAEPGTSTQSARATTNAVADRAVISVVLPKAFVERSAEGVRGRVMLFLVRDGARVGGGRGGRGEPSDAPFFESPQPMFGVDLGAAGEAGGAGGRVSLTEATEGFVGGGWGSLGELPRGKYRVQAALITDRGRGAWKETPGNWLSAVATMELGGAGKDGDAGAVKELVLTRETRARVWPATNPANAELFEVKSALLSKHYGREFTLRAGVRPPRGVVAGGGRRYAAVYEVPGFGGDHFAALSGGGRGGREGERGGIHEETYRIVLDPGSENGHTLFADSENNGPWGRALTEELIPALEARYPLVAKPEARLLRGHSSGGWSVLWLATSYPEVFGAAWSSAPDPVTFARFQLVDLYGAESFFSEKGAETPSIRAEGGGDGGGMTIREEVAMEEVLGPGRSSGQQWTSWQAVWGSRSADGSVRGLFDVRTGKVDREEAERYRRFDLVERLRADPERLAKLWRGNVRLIVGTQDDYYLEGAVRLLAAELDRLSPLPVVPAGGKAQWGGHITFVEGADHSSVLFSPAGRAIAGEMLEHLRVHGLVRDAGK